MAKKVTFEELAIAGARRLFPREELQASLQNSLAFALSVDAMKNARPCASISARDFWVRTFYSGFEIRVLFEVGDDITVWSIARVGEPL
jgi:hypothetical protein